MTITETFRNLITLAVIMEYDKSAAMKLWTVLGHVYHVPNGHTTWNPRRFDVDITSIHPRPNSDEFPRHFRVLFRCNFDRRAIHVVFTYFFRCNFADRKIHVISTYFFRCNFDGRKIHVVSRTFISVISMVEICTLFLLFST